MFELGFVLLSQRVVKTMRESAHFAKFVGDCLGRHLRGDSGQMRTPRWATGAPVSSVYWFKNREVQVSTELDKNGMPRTSVVFPEESGHA
jgi:hypothetical protein